MLPLNALILLFSFPIISSALDGPHFKKAAAADFVTLMLSNFKIQDISDNFNYSYRIPDGVAPVHYELLFDFNPGQSNVAGFANISCQVIEETDSIIMHAHNDLEIDHDSLHISHDGKNLEKSSVSVTARYQIITINMKKTLTKGMKIELSSEFKTLIRSDPSGQTLGIFRNTSTHSQYPLYFTEMQLHGARRMFPCWDEPKFKATFGLTIALHGTLATDKVSVFSYMQPETVEQGGGSKIVKFPKSSSAMPTYLFSFTIGEYDLDFCQEPAPCDSFIETQPNEDKGPGQICSFIPRVYSETIEFEEKLRAIDETQLFYCHMQNVTKAQVPYQQHFVWVPLVVGIGNENFGSVYIKAEGSDAQQFKQLYYHEVEHYYFGNWVSPADWEDLWMNEGFASYFSQYSLLSFGRNRNIKDIINEAKENFNDMQSKGMDPKDGPGLVDESSAKGILDSQAQVYRLYVKAPLIVLMLKSVLGETLFHQCVTDFMSEYGGKAAYSHDFMSSFQKTVDQNNFRGGWNKSETFRVKEFLYPYLYKSNHSTIVIKRNPLADDYGVVKFDPEYTVYVPKPGEPLPKVPPSIWHAPLWLYDKETHTSHMVWVEDHENIPKIPHRDAIRIKDASKYDINVDHFGYYSLNYRVSKKKLQCFR